MFIGRKEELEELGRRWNSGKFELGIIYGTRRIGKTSLLDEFIKGKQGFRFQARQGTEEENLRAFSSEFNRFRGLKSSAVYESFDAALYDLAEYSRAGRIVFIIDEIAYLCVKSKSFLSTLQYYIDGPFKDADMLLILSGSNVSFMKNILNNRNDPLYKRATFEMNIKRLPITEALAFLEDAGKEEKIKYLTLFGNYPYYLSMINCQISFEENMRYLLFGKYGTLSDAPDKVLPSGTAEKSIYNTVLRAVANGKRSSKEISDYVGENSNYTANYLTDLVEMEILEKRESFNRSKKMNYYVIADNVLRFWYRFIYDVKDIIELGLGDAVMESKRVEIADFIARGFEDVAIDYMTELNRERKLPFIYGAIRNFKADNSKLGRSVELDGLAESIMPGDSALMVIECKYRNSPFTMSMLRHLEESVSVLGDYNRRDYYIFSKTGVADEVIKAMDERLHIIGIEDIVNIATA